MNWETDDILDVLDRCAERNSFPMLDNGYVYLAASRLSLFRSPSDWAMVIEIFGYSPRASLPDTHLYTFGSKVERSRREADFVSREAYDAYVENNPHNESTFVFPIEAGSWQDTYNDELMSPEPSEVSIRGRLVATPTRTEYSARGLELESSENVHVFEFCRWLAETERQSVLATPEERRICVSPELVQILQLEEWRHPDLLSNERPSELRTFRALAEALIHGRAERHQAPEPSNTDWRNWPGGGAL